MPALRLLALAAMMACLGGAALAQDEELPLGNWAAAPYWNPTVQPRSEGESGGGMFAQAQGMQAQAEALPSSPLPFVAIAPCRIVDTRVAADDGFHRPNFADDEARTFYFPSSPDCPGLPATAGAFSVNIQFRPMTQLSYLTAYPTGTTMPLVSTMTAGPSAWVQNAAIVPAGDRGAIDIYCQYAGRVVIDINGYYGPHSVVTSLNSTTGDVTLAEGANVAITPSGNTLTIAATGGPGGELPTGTTGQTLYHNGLAWAPSSALTNDGTDVGVSGRLELPATTATSGQITMAGVPFLHGYGATTNVFVGRYAGNFTMTGTWNTGLGYASLYHNAEGTENTGAGYRSLNHNTTASKNTAIGTDALYTQSFSNGGTAWDSLNTAVGYQALYSNQPISIVTGIHNTAFGAGGLKANTTGSHNTAGGYMSLYANTMGDSNTASGASSLKANTTGSSNTAIGDGSLSANTTANKNTAVGDAPLFTQAYDNGGVAWDSGNTAVGYQALYSNQPTTSANGQNNSALGAKSLYSNTTGDGNTASGADSLSANTIGSNNTAVGVHAGDTNATGSSNTFLGASSDASANNLTNAVAIGAFVVVDASNKVRIGNVFTNVIEGQVAWSWPSDARMKEDIRDLDLGLDFVMHLRPVSFTMKQGNGRTDMGFIAQDVEALLGDGYNVLGFGGDQDRTLSLRGTDLIAPLVKAVQEQQAEIVALKALLVLRDDQQRQIDELRRQLETLAERELAQR